MSTAVVLCAAYLIVQPASVDFASGDFRARLFRSGAFVWNNRWFAGHPLPGYGLLSPMMAGLLGAVPVAIASVLVGTWCFSKIMERCREVRSDLPNITAATVLFSLGCALNLWTGRLTFGPSVAFGTAAVLALQRRRPWLAVALAALCGLSSPVGAVSLVIVLIGCWIVNALPRRPTVLSAMAATTPVLVTVVLFPEGGWYPFTVGSLALLTTALAVVAWLGRREPLVKAIAGVYWLAAIAAFMVRSPLGGNIVRLGWLAAGPAALLVTPRARRMIMPAIAVLSLVWGWSYASMAFRPADASASEHYYDSLARYVNSLPGGSQRVEVVPTETLRQADELAMKINIARGWETQIDRKLNPGFYETPMDSGEFEEWLHDNAVSLVALPLSRIQESSSPEADLIRSRPAYLKPAWSNSGWDVYRVVDAQPLASNGVEVLKVEPESLTVLAPQTGESIIRFRYTKMYEVTVGQACITEGPDGWIDLHVATPGILVLHVKLTADAFVGEPADCH
ncbi:MAG: hypothetical protein ABIQ39_12860 [Ilumatobacteraceae bacterium]